MAQLRPFATLPIAFAATLACASAVAAPSDGAAFRVMLHPRVAAAGELPDATLARIETISGTKLTRVGTTRTGAIELAPADPAVALDVAALVRRLRLDRAVLWAEAGSTAGVKAKAAARDPDGALPGRKLLVRPVDAAADWATLLPRLSARAGQALTLERTIGAVHVLALERTVTQSELAAIAEAVQQDPALRYADPVRRLQPKRVPNDPMYESQWSLSDPVGGIGAPGAWTLGTGTADVVVAVVDTGILDHPDLAGRMLPGYDFISDPERARDGDGRDANPRDEGSWNDDGDCGGMYAEDSFWHGLFVTGLIGANADNGVGIAGVNWAAKIVPVRALGKCGGSWEDVFAGVLWAAGVPVAGAPVNAHPAKVINLSLGGYGSCGGALQEAVDEALAQGTIVVASAGNETDDTDNYAPANCGGVVAVGATTRGGERTGYSNFGRRVDLSAPGGDGDPADWMLSTFNDGTKGPGAPGYAYAVGTSFSAPLVSGAASLMLARNPNLTAGQLLSILQGTAREFPLGTTCRIGGFCGIGLLDLTAALSSTLPASASAPLGTVPVVEFYDAALDHYMLTSDPLEIAILDGSGRWTRTGHAFYAYADPSLAPQGVALRNVCRFYAGDVLIDSHFFTADPAECGYLAAQGGAVWRLETPAAFHVEVPDAGGMCREGTLPVYRFFDNRRDANHRYTIDLSVRRAMINRAWVPEGPGVNGATFCSPI